MLHSLGRIGKKKTQLEPQQSAEPQQEAVAPSYADKVHAATHDHAKDIIFDHIRRVGGVDFKTAAQLWDHFHLHSKNSAELAEHLKDVPVADELKHALWTAKQQTDAAPAPKTWRDKLDKVVAAIHTIGSKKLPIAHVEKGEKHPHVMRALTDAAMKEHDEDK